MILLALMMLGAPIPEQGAIFYTDTVSDCRAVDGDTLRCGRERIRLRGIDAPELPGHCRQGRECAPGDPFASTASLQSVVTPVMRIRRIEKDRYGRTVALVSGAKGDLSCWQLRQKQAVYKPTWDRPKTLPRICFAAGEHRPQPRTWTPGLHDPNSLRGEIGRER